MAVTQWSWYSGAPTSWKESCSGDSCQRLTHGASPWQPVKISLSQGPREMLRRGALWAIWLATRLYGPDIVR